MANYSHGHTRISTHFQLHTFQSRFESTLRGGLNPDSFKSYVTRSELKSSCERLLGLDLRLGCNLHVLFSVIPEFLHLWTHPTSHSACSNNYFVLMLAIWHNSLLDNWRIEVYLQYICALFSLISVEQKTSKGLQHCLGP